MFISRFIIGALAAVAVTFGSLGAPGTSSPPEPSRSPQEALWPSKPLQTTTSSTTSTTSSTTSTLPAQLVRAETPCQEWLPLLLQAGWPQDTKVLEKALRIMFRESRCLPWADSGPDHGLFQINVFWSSSESSPPNWLSYYGIAPDHAALFDPLTNVRAALALYRYSLERNGDGWHPWRLPTTTSTTIP